MSKDIKYLVLENYIGGNFVPCSKLINSFNPSTGEVYCKVPDSGPEELDAAVRAAKEAFPDWSAKSPAERSKVLNKLADLIEARLEEFALAESKDQGKTIETALDLMSCLNYTVRCPVGVAGLISPWNLPLYLLTWKIGRPAVATGNTAVAKPCEMTLVSHPDVPLISFTGSTATARLITERSATYCKKLSMELGGKNPAIIFADADMEQCINLFSLLSQGEICLCTRRIFIERGIYPEFLARFVETARRWKTGVPSDPLKRQWTAHQQRVKGYVALALTEGAQVHCGEGVDKSEDSFALMQEEISGPVTCVTPFDEEKEVISWANGVHYEGGKDSYHFFTEVKSITKIKVLHTVLGDRMWVNHFGDIKLSHSLAYFILRHTSL
uniref:Aldehyde dehydrogenase 8 family, member A1 n=1 Tax=Cyprinus carpio TaxID=7962 RepID=A0A8C1MMV1_CYPCA